MRTRELRALLDACQDRLYAEAFRFRHAGASALKAGDEERAEDCYARAQATLDAVEVVGRAIGVVQMAQRRCAKPSRR